ncbi:hypothetical protein A4A49_13058 [Nicotiana attenuata]|uniref:Uncharacterized protein n=1 Tax=Nicotiana attenuata TaxID=49451 RepID=A0A1J6IGU6_NICAT|nr:hypothetical protein A4A49_13058 [Nicotiana attenuata]
MTSNYFGQPTNITHLISIFKPFIRSGNKIKEIRGTGQELDLKCTATNRSDLADHVRRPRRTTSPPTVPQSQFQNRLNGRYRCAWLFMVVSYENGGWSVP